MGANLTVGGADGSSSEEEEEEDDLDPELARKLRELVGDSGRLHDICTWAIKEAVGKGASSSSQDKTKEQDANALATATGMINSSTVAPVSTSANGGGGGGAPARNLESVEEMQTALNVACRYAEVCGEGEEFVSLDEAEELFAPPSVGVFALYALLKPFLSGLSQSLDEGMAGLAKGKMGGCNSPTGTGDTSRKPESL